MRISLHPAAERDLHEAASFYEREGSAVLAGRFVAEFKRLTRLLGEHPDMGSPRTKGKRGVAMSVFPFTVIYRVSPDRVTVLVVKHDRKRPGYGGTRA